MMVSMTITRLYLGHRNLEKSSAALWSLQSPWHSIIYFQEKIYKGWNVHSPHMYPRGERESGDPEYQHEPCSSKGLMYQLEMLHGWQWCRFTGVRLASGLELLCMSSGLSPHAATSELSLKFSHCESRPAYSKMLQNPLSHNSTKRFLQNESINNAKVRFSSLLINNDNSPPNREFPRSKRVIFPLW